MSILLNSLKIKKIKKLRKSELNLRWQQLQRFRKIYIRKILDKNLYLNIRVFEILFERWKSNINFKFSPDLSFSKLILEYMILHSSRKCDISKKM